MSNSLSPGEALYPLSPPARIDRALRALRRLPPAELFAAIWPSAILLGLTVALYFIERVEGVRALRPVFGLAFTGAFVLRSVLLSRWSGRRVETLLSEQGITAHHGSTQVLMRASLWIGLDLWFWLWLLVLAIYIEPWLCVIVIPTFCLRAALVPSFLASADGATQETGFSLLRAAIEEGDGQRMTAIVIELLLLLGALGLAFNVAAVTITVLGLGQDMLGLDLSFVRAFLSPRNYFALLIISGVSLVCMEPVRAMLSALFYVETRLARDGLALRILVDRCVAEGLGRASRLALAFLFLTAVPNASFAQESTEEDAQAQAPEPDLAPEEDGASAAPSPCDEACERARTADELVNRRIELILKDSIFAEFPDERWDMKGGGLSSLLDRLAKWLKELSRDEQAKTEHPSSLSLPGAPFFLIVAALAALLAWLTFGRKRAPAPVVAKPDVAPEDPLSRSPDEHLNDALSYRDGDLTLALRSLYLATLVGLSRQGYLTLSPERTNGQYLNELRGRAERPLFSSLTRTFDVVHYGRQPPTRADFDHCLTLAQQLVGKRAP